MTLIRACRLPAGLGEPLYHRLDGALADALMGLNAVKAVEIGDGVRSSTQYGNEHNDEMSAQGFTTNHSGGILGGISNGNTLVIKVHFKPTPSIFIPQHTLNTQMRSKYVISKDGTTLAWRCVEVWSLRLWSRSC